MKVNSIIITFMEKVYIDGVMVDNILETGEMIKWLEKVTLLGQMEERKNILIIVIKDNIQTIKNMDMVSLYGQMVKNMW